jgi:hypothetical protein
MPARAPFVAPGRTVARVAGGLAGARHSRVKTVWGEPPTAADAAPYDLDNASEFTGRRAYPSRPHRPQQAHASSGSRSGSEYPVRPPEKASTGRFSERRRGRGSAAAIELDPDRPRRHPILAVREAGEPFSQNTAPAAAAQTFAPGAPFRRREKGRRLRLCASVPASAAKKLRAFRVSPQ